MKATFLKVVKCGDAFTVKSEKSENGLRKRNIVLQELGGKYEDQFVVATLGELADVPMKEGDIVLAALRFHAREYNGQQYQDITATELINTSN